MKAFEKLMQMYLHALHGAASRAGDVLPRADVAEELDIRGVQS
jgi:hypothetical protein